MILPELVRAFAHDACVAVVVTDAAIVKPGPTILYANEAFSRLTGRAADELVGLSPRFMQGRETRRAILDQFASALISGERFHGYLTNYRADGSKYVAEIDCRPLRNADGVVEYFVSFEREVTRRRGRPFAERFKRFEPVVLKDDLLTAALRDLRLFESRNLPETK